MAIDLDPLDHRILALLVKDGRQPTSQIADEIRLSRPAVAERMARLERAGVILGTTAVVDPAALGRRVTAFVSARAQAHMGTAANKRLRTLLTSDEIVEAHTVAGDDCYLLKVRTDSIQSLNTLVTKLTAPPLSLVTRTTIVMQTHCEKVGGIRLRGDVS